MIGALAAFGRDETVGCGVPGVLVMMGAALAAALTAIIMLKYWNI
jgi:hypothetical protein